jgi:hypothetical protein
MRSLIIILLVRYYYCGKIKENEMGKQGNTRGADKSLAL